MKLFQTLIIFYSLLFSATSLAAETVEGRILRIDKEVFVYINPGDQLLPLKAVTSIDQRALQRLESGDFITGEGRITDKEVRLHSLFFVGLQRLLGLWRSKNWELFEFRTFEDLKLYWPLNWERPVRNIPLRVKSYSYNLSPAPDSHWAMLLVDFDSVELARLNFSNKKLYVELLDRNTGEVKHTFQLTQIALEQPSR